MGHIDGAFGNSGQRDCLVSSRSKRPRPILVVLSQNTAIEVQTACQCKLKSRGKSLEVILDENHIYLPLFVAP